MPRLYITIIYHLVVGQEDPTTASTRSAHGQHRVVGMRHAAAWGQHGNSIFTWWSGGRTLLRKARTSFFSRSASPWRPRFVYGMARLFMACSSIPHGVISFFNLNNISNILDICDL